MLQQYANAMPSVRIPPPVSLLEPTILLVPLQFDSHPLLGVA